MSAATPLPAASLLQLIWLASPALPVGGFSYSEGLEAAVEWAGVATEEGARDWLLDQLWLTQSRTDLAVLACGDDERQAFSPMLAILSAQHEAQYSRLFRS